MLAKISWGACAPGVFASLQGLSSLRCLHLSLSCCRMTEADVCCIPRRHPRLQELDLRLIGDREGQAVRALSSLHDVRISLKLACTNVAVYGDRLAWTLLAGLALQFCALACGEAS